MNKKRCIEILSKIIVDCIFSLQKYNEQEKDRFQEKIEALRYAKKAVEREDEE